MAGVRIGVQCGLVGGFTKLHMLPTVVIHYNKTPPNKTLSNTTAAAEAMEMPSRAGFRSQGETKRCRPTKTANGCNRLWCSLPSMALEALEFIQG